MLGLPSLSRQNPTGFNVVIRLSVVHVVPHIIADRLIATEPMIAKGQMKYNGARQTPAEQFYFLVT